MGNEFQMLVCVETIVKIQARIWKSAAGPGSLHLPSPILPGGGGHILSIGGPLELVDKADSWASPTEILVLETQAGARW